MRYVKYTKEILTPLVAMSTCVREVVLGLGGKPGSGTQGYVAKLIKKFEIDTSHSPRQTFGHTNRSC